jgi:hypothetical protein
MEYRAAMPPSRHLEAAAAHSRKDIDDHAAESHMVISGRYPWFGVDMRKVQRWKQDPIAIRRQ